MKRIRVALIGKYPVRPEKIVLGPVKVFHEVVSRLTSGDLVKAEGFSPIRPGDLLHPREIVRAYSEGCRVLPVSLIGLLLRAKQFSCVHLVGLPGYRLWPILRNKNDLGFRLVYSISGIASFENRMGSRHPDEVLLAERMILKHADVITIPSSLLQDDLLREFSSLDEGKITVVPHGVNDSYFQETDPRLFIERFNLPESKKLIFTAGGTRAVKGIVPLLNAVKQLGNRSDFILVIAGYAGDDHTLVLKEIAEMTDQDIRLVGNLNPELLRSAYWGCDIYCQFSRYDSFGLAPLEAMAAGRSVVVSDRVGMCDLISSGENGFLVPYDNIEKLSSVLRQLLDDPEMRGRIGQKAQMTASNVTWDKAVESYMSIYHDVLREGSAKPCHQS